MIARAALEVAAAHPAFAGHFPANPVLPGAVLIDEVLAVLGRAHSLDLTRWQLAAVKFLGAISPGEHLNVEHETQPTGAIRFVVRAGERDTQRAVASGMLSAPVGGGDAG